MFDIYVGSCILCFKSTMKEKDRRYINRVVENLHTVFSIAGVF